MPNVYTDPSAGGNVPNWQEDANSPLVVSGASSGIITLAGTYDTVKCVFAFEGNNKTNQIALRVNGDTGANYAYIDNSDAYTGSVTEIPYNQSRLMQGVELVMRGRWDLQITGWNDVFSAATGGEVVSWKNSNVTSPLDSITIFDTGGGNISATMHVYGLDQ